MCVKAFKSYMNIQSLKRRELIEGRLTFASKFPLEAYIPTA